MTSALKDIQTSDALDSERHPEIVGIPGEGNHLSANVCPGPEWTSDPAHMDIDLSAITANLAEVRRRVGPQRTIIVVLKADAYGHGCAAVALHLERAGVDFFAAGSIRDAASIRAAGVSAPMLLLSALQPEMIEKVLDLDLIPVIDHWKSAEALSRSTKDTAVVFVKIDCGFGRFGVPLTRAVALMRALVGLDRLRVEGVFTHVPFSDLASRDWAVNRLREFEELIATLAAEGIRPNMTQALASPGVFVGLTDHHNAVAVGHLLYGLRPVGTALAEAAGFSPFRTAVSAVKTKLVHVGEKPPDAHAAGYLRGAAGPIGVIPIGIHHSYRPVSAEAFVIVDGLKAPVLRPCLENTVIDLSGIPNAASGTEALILGSRGELTIGIDDLASWQSSSALSVLLGLGRSVTRRYLESEGESGNSR